MYPEEKKSLLPVGPEPGPLGGVTIHWTGLLDWITGLDYWTRLKWCKMPFQAFFSVGEKLIMFIQPTSLLNLLP